MSDLNDEMREGIVFIGSALGPLYLSDPKLDAEKVAPVFKAIQDLDVDEASRDWPFAAQDVVHVYLTWMQDGLSHGASEDPDLIWEYRMLFVGPDKKAAPPWGSVYTDKDMVTFGASTMQLRDFLRLNGVHVARMASDEPEDHVGTMLELMAWICANKPELLEEYLQEHFLTWASHFLEQAEHAAEQPFYRGLAGLTRVSLEAIQEKLGLQVDYPRFYR